MGVEVKGVFQRGRKQVVSVKELGVKVVMLQNKDRVQAFVYSVYPLKIVHYMIICNI
jgi:hypothetical protein